MHYSKPGNGISHYVHLERFAAPGEVPVGADSHSSMAGGAGRIFEFHGDGVAGLSVSERGTVCNMIVE